MSDFVDINVNTQPARANTISWFDAISPGRASRVVTPATCPPPSSTNMSTKEIRQSDLAVKQRHQENDLTVSTICYDDESNSSLLRRLNSTVTPPRPHTNLTDGEMGTSVVLGEYSTAAAASPQRRMASSGAVPRSRRRCDDMYEEAVRGKLAKRQWAAAEQIRQSILERARIERDCTFQPQLSPYAKKLHRPSHLAPENRIYEELMRKSEWRAQKQKEHIEDELKGCTFRPLTVQAAKLKSSAHVHDSHIFSELYNHHEEQQYFRDELRPRVVQHLEQQILYKNPSNKIVSENKMSEVVERLISRGAIVQADRQRAKSAAISSETFKPAISTKSERIVSRQQDAGLLSEDVLERLMNPPKTMSQDRCQRREREEKLFDEDFKEICSEYLKGVRVSLRKELEKNFISAKFDALADYIHREEPDYKGCDSRVDKYPIKQLLKAAVSILSAEEGDELVHILTHSRSPALNRKGFVTLCLKALAVVEDPRSSALASLPPPPSNSGNGNRTGSVDNTDKNRRDHLNRLRHNLSPEEVAAIKASALERQQRRTEEELQRQRAKEEEEMRECTFRPQTTRKIPRECRSGRYTNVRITKGEMLRRAHIRKSRTESVETPSLDLPIPLVRDIFKKLKIPTAFPSPQRRAHSAGAHPGVCGKHRQIRTTAVLKSPKQRVKSTSRRSRAEGDQQGVATRAASAVDKKSHFPAKSKGKEEAACAAVPSEQSSEDAAGTYTGRSFDGSPWPNAGALFRGAASEHGVFGGEGALTDLGRQLILQQLREYRSRQR
ncbi:hypothetical protein, conserved [Trypanosoma brucei gambiense DAL972]|uniref:Uncharacterized protein n=1 Tax=Trypanosoma brucei gambiense (strain MHOM/CI/86/DAL972) TaxID=679716 RepID=D0A5R2_TRYB9|nr:hypothetical protein, conserved [Trypanosoma brucei gambiense DAL972]CBH17013.1 hypothetical protein, conserved [Trypanosoma brucei gambiense DAL972]|eukprot:XP_011779277.1 hypothetical protein, conserved [Trypanosoma brucei gambiense DAL972]